MAEQPTRKMFLNLAVSDLKKSIDFFKKLSFQFNPKFTDDNAACMIVSDDAYVMLLAKPFFKTFTSRDICDTGKYSESLVALSYGSRAEVDEIVKKALAAGGTPAMGSKDHGFMYVNTFYDPDGHHWEMFWMDPAAAQKRGGVYSEETI